VAINMSALNIPVNTPYPLKQVRLAC
jgi:hypothetical protein